MNSYVNTVWRGVVATSSLLCLLITLTWLPRYLGLGVSLACFMALTVPFVFNSYRTIDRALQQTINAREAVRLAKAFLLGLQGLGFACWLFDVISTIFIIDIQQVAIELNFLGWPLSALGALVFYVPMLAVVYFLLYRVKTKFSFYAALIISVLVLFMGALNINASLHNFNQIYPYRPFEDSLVVGVWLAILTGLAALNLVPHKQRKIHEPLQV